MSWRKRLRAMLDDPKPTSYTYDDAVAILRQLQFAPPERKPKGTHRSWRRKLPNGTTVVVGLVDSGKGTMKRYLVEDMVRQLRENSLVPPDVTGEADDQGSDDVLDA